MAKNSENNTLTEAVFYILLSLYSPLHGYGIMKNIRVLSNDRVSLGAGTLYGAINTLLTKKWIKPLNKETGSRKKEYQITDFGKIVVEEELIRLEEMLKNGKQIVKY